MPEMFLHNKYTNYYNRIINKAQSRTLEGYVERHHIIPKSLGGSNDKSNLVSLTAREHFICHLLLSKMLEGKNKTKMVYAIWIIINTSKNVNINNRTYEIIRKELINNAKIKNIGNKNPMYNVRKFGKENPNYGNKWTEEQKLFISQLNKYRKLSDETKKRMSCVRKDKSKSKEHKIKIGKANKGKHSKYIYILPNNQNFQDLTSEQQKAIIKKFARNPNQKTIQYNSLQLTRYPK
jgi:hypothetical protein